MPITIEVIPITAREFSEDLLVLRAAQKLPSEPGPIKMETANYSS
jgi:hypothetical protein